MLQATQNLSNNNNNNNLKVIVVAFVVTAVLWLTRTGIGRIPGWITLFSVDVRFLIFSEPQ